MTCRTWIWLGRLLSSQQSRLALELQILLKIESAVCQATYTVHYCFLLDLCVDRAFGAARCGFQGRHLILIYPRNAVICDT